MQGTFQKVLTAAINDLVENGFDSMERVNRWTSALRAAAERSMKSQAALDAEMREALSAIYRRMIDRGGIFRMNPGVDRFLLDRVRPALRAELDRRILASANLIKLNRAEAVEKTLRRFEGWSTSIPRGGTAVAERRQTKQRVRKSIAGLPYVERRVIIDQGHKLSTSLNEILATDGGAIAGRWSSRWRQPGYNYREDHKERDGQIYLVRDSWAHKQGLVKPGGAGYYDKVTAAGQEVNCRCSVVWIYNLRDLPRDMLTAKGKASLENAQKAARADASDKVSKTEANYVGPFTPREDHRRCDECTMFRKKRLACTAVGGVIDPGGWCKFWEAI